MRRLSPAEAGRWLAQPALFADSPHWEASVWIVHAMYEAPALSGLSHDDLERLERGAGVPPGRLPPEAGELLAAARIAHSGLGRSRWPGPGWRRLRWVQIAERIGVDPFAADLRFQRFPANILGPTEGSLDREQFLRLVAHLAEATASGQRAPCCAFYQLLWSDDEPAGRVLYSGRLAELADLYDDASLPGSPTKLWPRDRTWLLHTDPDDWTTTLSGTAELITRLAADPELETRDHAL